MASLDQLRAQIAFRHVTEVNAWDEGDRDKYRSTMMSLPALVRSAGLSQALHFIYSRVNGSKPGERPWNRKLLGQLAEQLARVDATLFVAGKVADDGPMLEAVRKADLASYLRLTQETLASVNWYIRFVQGELKVSAKVKVKEELDNAPR
jgi:CRISPR-associated protein Cmr5